MQKKTHPATDQASQPTDRPNSVYAKSYKAKAKEKRIRNTKYIIKVILKHFHVALTMKADVFLEWEKGQNFLTKEDGKKKISNKLNKTNGETRAGFTSELITHNYN